MADLDDKDILEPNTRPNEDIFDDDPPPGLTPDDNQLVDDGELAPDETTLDDQIAADREADKAAAEAKGVADEDGIVIEDAEEAAAEKRTKKEPYGKRAEKAIAKANSGKKSAESRADQAERNLAEYRQREDDAKGQNAKSAVARHETNITQKEGDVDRLRTSLKKSQEDGEAEESARIIDEMTDAKIDIRESTYALRQAKQKSAEYDQEVETRGKGGGAADSGVTGETNNWMKRNSAWFQPNTPERDAAVSAENMVAAAFRRGAFAHAPDTREYWDEVDRRLKAEIPDLDIAEFEEEEPDNEPQPRPTSRRNAATPVSGARRGAPAENKTLAGNQKQVVITSLDKKTMRSHKLDPTNRDDLRAYADEKRRMAPEPDLE